jgi:hypothetical protein
MPHSANLFILADQSLLFGIAPISCTICKSRMALGEQSRNTGLRRPCIRTAQKRPPRRTAPLGEADGPCAVGRGVGRPTCDIVSPRPNARERSDHHTCGPGHIRIHTLGNHVGGAHSGATALASGSTSTHEAAGRSCLQGFGRSLRRLLLKPCSTASRSSALLV